MVHDYECREAAVYLGYRWPEFVQLGWFDKACAVAHYRLHNLIEAHVNDAIVSKQERAARRAHRR